MRELPLEGKVVVVTGGAGLLGRSFAAEVARQGGVAVIADRNQSAAEAVASEAAQGGVGSSYAAPLDITDPDSVLRLIELIQERSGRIDALVNNAYPRNANYGRRLEDVAYGDFCDNVSMHLGGYFLASQKFAVAFKAQGHGNILNMASIYGVMAPRFQVYEGTSMTMPVEYAAIKSGVIHLTKYFAQYYKADGIRVNTLSPGGIFDSQPEAFLARYKEFAGAKGMLDSADILGSFVFLLSDASRYVTGQNIVVDDGFSL
jgi:NAD(P)-dependent dehydrogenase (short-subunit alcohol dehydrogenase family)